MKPVIPVSVGDLADRVSILQVKSARLSGDKQRAAGRELAALESAFRSTGVPVADYAVLVRINAELWDIEEAKREHMARHDYSAAFRALSRSVVELNDARARVKRRINEATGSEIVEVKSHVNG